MGPDRAKINLGTHLLCWVCDGIWEILQNISTTVNYVRSGILYTFEMGAYRNNFVVPINVVIKNCPSSKPVLRCFVSELQKHMNSYDQQMFSRNQKDTRHYLEPSTPDISPVSPF